MPPSAENLAKAREIKLYVLFQGDIELRTWDDVRADIAAALDAVRAEERARAEAVVQTDPGAYSAEDETADMRAAIAKWEAR